MQSVIERDLKIAEVIEETRISLIRAMNLPKV